eukprot:TRINITY_DN12811_c0_g1_i1.p1 TRINITY_DN12811_c0_g1~~TRINITY_DN12811_c0_g1_i1.p1  ORF type:complete len:537 (+),score=56.31 TRINITY_DN12811_c0_g1_i1:71-1681(+)
MSSSCSLSSFLFQILPDVITVEATVVGFVLVGCLIISVQLFFCHGTNPAPTQTADSITASKETKLNESVLSSMESPSFLIQNDEVNFDFDKQSRDAFHAFNDEEKRLLTENALLIKNAIRCSCRINCRVPFFSWQQIGTGTLFAVKEQNGVKYGYISTALHITDDNPRWFRTKYEVDFRSEFNTDSPSLLRSKFNVVEIIPPANKDSDNMILKIEGVPENLDPPAFSGLPPQCGDLVFAVGYPNPNQGENVDVVKHQFRELHGMKFISFGCITSAPFDNNTPEVATSVSFKSFLRNSSATSHKGLTVTHNVSTTSGFSGCSVFNVCTGTFSSLHIQGVKQKIVCFSSMNEAIPYTSLQKELEVVGARFDPASQTLSRSKDLEQAKPHCEEELRSYCAENHFPSPEYSDSPAGIRVGCLSLHSKSDSLPKARELLARRMLRKLSSLSQAEIDRDILSRQHLRRICEKRGWKDPAFQCVCLPDGRYRITVFFPEMHYVRSGNHDNADRGKHLMARLLIVAIEQRDALKNDRSTEASAI